MLNWIPKYLNFKKYPISVVTQQMTNDKKDEQIYGIYNLVNSCQSALVVYIYSHHIRNLIWSVSRIVSWAINDNNVTIMEKPVGELD